MTRVASRMLSAFTLKCNYASYGPGELSNNALLAALAHTLACLSRLFCKRRVHVLLKLKSSFSLSPTSVLQSCRCHCRLFRRSLDNCMAVGRLMLREPIQCSGVLSQVAVILTYYCSSSTTQAVV